MGKESKAKLQADLLARLQACSMYSQNRVCADCAEPNPTMVSLLLPPHGAYTNILGVIKADKKKEKKEHKENSPVKKTKKDKSKLVAVFCCKKCINDHMLMGREICEVKSIKVAEQWSEDTVAAVELSGNLAVNCIYEAKLDPKEKKDVFSESNPEALQRARSVFVAMKYRDLDYFDAKLYKKYWLSRKNPRMYGTVTAFTDIATDQKLRTMEPDKGLMTRSSSDPNVLFSKDDPDSDSDAEKDLSEKKQRRMVKQLLELRKTAGIGTAHTTSTFTSDTGTNNLDFTNPAVLADLGYGPTHVTSVDLGYGDAAPDVALTQELALRSVRPRNRASVGGNAGNGMTRNRNSIGGIVGSGAARNRAMSIGGTAGNGLRRNRASIGGTAGNGMRRNRNSMGKHATNGTESMARPKSSGNLTDLKGSNHISQPHRLKLSSVSRDLRDSEHKSSSNCHRVDAARIASQREDGRHSVSNGMVRPKSSGSLNLGGFDERSRSKTDRGSDCLTSRRRLAGSGHRERSPMQGRSRGTSPNRLPNTSVGFRLSSSRLELDAVTRQPLKLETTVSDVRSLESGQQGRNEPTVTRNLELDEDPTTTTKRRTHRSRSRSAGRLDIDRKGGSSKVKRSGSDSALAVTKNIERDSDRKETRHFRSGRHLRSGDSTQSKQTGSKSPTQNEARLRKDCSKTEGQTSSCRSRSTSRGHLDLERDDSCMDSDGRKGKERRNRRSTSRRIESNSPKRAARPVPRPCGSSTGILANCGDESDDGSLHADKDATKDNKMKPRQSPTTVKHLVDLEDD